MMNMIENLINLPDLPDSHQVASIECDETIVRVELLKLSCNFKTAFKHDKLIALNHIL